jgi:GNAT superfamily N-acetyltransferase
MILADTPIWIGFLRAREPALFAMAPLLEQQAILGLQCAFGSVRPGYLLASSTQVAIRGGLGKPRTLSGNWGEGLRTREWTANQVRQHGGIEGADYTAVSRVGPKRPPGVEALALLEILAWGKQFAREQIASRAARIEMKLHSLDPAEKLLFVASGAGIPVGAVRLWRDSNDLTVWWVVGLLVHPQYRRRGVATRLTEACVAHARIAQGRLIRSETHLGNLDSIRFHEGFGSTNDDRLVAPDRDQKVAFSSPVQ